MLKLVVYQLINALFRIVKQLNTVETFMYP